jgi:hypothetical protein
MRPIQWRRSASWILAGSVAWAAAPVERQPPAHAGRRAPRAAGQATAAAPFVAEVLRPAGALPAEIASTLLDPIACVETSAGEALVLDRGASAVYAIDAARKNVRPLLQAGFDERGLMTPGALALGPDDMFAVADAVRGVERIQYFTAQGTRVGGFYLPDRPRLRVTVNGVPINGIGSLQFASRSFFVNMPSRGRLVSELNVDGQTLRQFGLPRSTGQAPDPDLDAVLNVGVPLINPGGGFYFVFQTGRPLFRKYDASGELLFERHIEGPELDAAILALPTEWRPRAPDEDRTPIANALVRTAAVDRLGRLWIALNAPVTYVYDAQGNKVRTVQFDAAGPLLTRSLFFADRGRVLVTPKCYEFGSR